MSQKRVRLRLPTAEALFVRSDALEVYRDALVELVGFSTCEESRTIARSALDEVGELPKVPLGPEARGEKPAPCD